MSGHDSIFTLIAVLGLLGFAERVHSWYDIKFETRWVLSATAISILLLVLGVDIVGRQEGLLFRLLWVPICYYGVKYLLKFMMYMLDDAK